MEDSSDTTAPIQWPSDVLGRFLHFLALAGDVDAPRVWHQLAFCVLKDNDLRRTARRAARPMIFQIQFDDASASPMKFKIPFAQAKIVCIDVDWGDGCVDAVREVGSGFIEHEYTEAGDYTVRVFPRNDYNDGSQDIGSLDHLGFDTLTVRASTVTWWQPLRSIISFGTCGVRSLSHLFNKAENIRIDLTKIDLRNITDLSGMFFQATNFNQPIGGWNVSNVTNMRHMFNGATAFNQPLGKWNVSNVTNMGGMFCGAAFDQPIGEWNVSKVTNMSGMFVHGKFNQPIGQWDMSSVANLSCMFSGAVAFDQPIGEWNVSNVTHMGYMFNGASAFNQPIGKWNVSNVTIMSAMFCNASAFNQPLGNWNVSNVTAMSHMFFDASAFNQPLDQWNIVDTTDLGIISSCKSGSADSQNTT